MNVARDQIDGDNLPRLLAHPEMVLSQVTAASTAHVVLADITFTGTEHLQPGAIDNYMPCLLRWCSLPSQIESALASAHHRVVRHRQYDVHEPYYRFQKSLGRAQTEMEDGLDDQYAVDGTIGIDSWPAAPLWSTLETPS